MSMSFVSPSMRAGGNDLAISISPLGLVELSDEEFEVNGPRLNRYAQAWAWFLGWHYAYRREAGEPQFATNYVRAFSEFIANFTFSRGVEFKTAPEYEAIIPGLLKKTWEVDNNKESILWEMGQQGGVSGDVFVKIAWEPEYQDEGGFIHPGKAKILVLNSAYCFPEWHPHDRERMTRFKLKYKFFGTAGDGTRAVYTYTEIITPEWIEEYINDEMIDQRQNVLGVIPVVHIPNIRVSGSPWGLSDIQDIIPLNREYNEKMLEISDIINYSAAPVTIITGGSASNLERGPKKVWSLPKPEARVTNLEGGMSGVAVALEYCETIKRSMHELTGVPESALGQMQPISNTSGVALSIMYTPLMQRYHQKQMSYGIGFKKINEYILKTLFVFDPMSTQFDPTTEGVLQADQQTFVDPADPLAYQTEVHWPPPLPVDTLIKLNEIMMKMELGLESKRGALADLGNEFPDEKMQEIFEELVADAKWQGALDMVKAKIASTIMLATGMLPGGEGAPPVPGDQPDPGKNADGSTKPAPPNPLSTIDAFETNKMLTELVTQAYGTKTPPRADFKTSDAAD